MVQGFEYCGIIRSFFEKQPFMTGKGKDFENWCKCLEIAKIGKHTTKEGILEICNIRDKMNFGKVKCKWTKEEVSKVFEAQPEHILVHYDQAQTSFIHNTSFDYLKHLESKQGNNKKPRKVLLQVE